jgi:hypothetical protein
MVMETEDGRQQTADGARGQEELRREGGEAYAGRVKLRFTPAIVALSLALASSLVGAEIWKLDSIEKIGGHAVTLEGTPRVVEEDSVKALVFDGVKDGAFLSAIPLVGAKEFTIEVLFKVAAGGPREQRFVHLQDAANGRGLIELRLNETGWWLDTFLLSSGKTQGLALIDPKRVHPADTWAWAALRYDGKIMSHYVNGEKELEGPLAFEPFGEGKTSLGVRQNKVSWYKGAIREVRFHREAVAPEKLQRVK